MDNKEIKEYKKLLIDLENLQKEYEKIAKQTQVLKQKYLLDTENKEIEKQLNEQEKKYKMFILKFSDLNKKTIEFLEHSSIAKNEESNN